MSKIRIDTDKVMASATRIKTLNNQIRDEFREVRDAMKKLDNAWDGSVATSAMSKFNDIKNTYCDARYDVVDNFVVFLQQRVGQGYAQTETANKSLADRFK